MVKVSIILPVYNVEEYIQESLDSCINQTLKDIEIICVNDCSTDNSLKILNDYAKKDERIKVISNEINSGSGISRNNGISIANGEYLAFLDPDDWVDLDFYEKLYNKAKENNYDIAKATRYIVPNRKDVLSKKLNNRILNRQIDNKKLWQLFTFEHVSAIYKSELVKKYNIKYGTTRRSQDTTFLLKVSYYTQNIAILDDEVHYYYRIRENSQTQNKELRYFLDNVDALKEKMLFLNSKFDELGLVEYANGIKIFFSKITGFYYKKNEYKESKKYFKQIFDEAQKLRDLIIELNNPECKNIYSKDKLLYCILYKNYNAFLVLKFNNFLKTIFSITNTDNGSRKVISILGIKIKIKRNK